MTAQQSVKDCKIELELLLGEERSQKLVAYLEDYARIASLMTDVATCRIYLARLSTHLSFLCHERRMIVKGALGVPTRELKTKTYRKRGVQGSRTVVKHNKVFTDFFNEWEALQGFNQGVTQVEGGRPSLPDQLINLPGQAPTLTEFVAPDDFRKYLLKHGYHWKDSGVGASHGEFTHRIHWYIICEYALAKPNWLSHKPIELFRKCGDPETVFPYGGKGIWDYIIDSGGKNIAPTQVTQGGAVNPNQMKDNYFRQPEFLHSFLCQNETRDSADLWCLAYLIWGRAEKRRFVGGDRTTSDLQKYIEKHDHRDRFKVVGFKTGEGVKTHGTIMWKDRH